MTDEILLSIIIPSFNQGDYIENSILSTLNQSYQDWELIIQDGKSTDKTLEICEKYASLDARITFFSEEDTGFADAVNKALKKCNGDFVSIQSSDDYYATSEVFAEINAIYQRHHSLTIISGQAVHVTKAHNLVICPVFPVKSGFLAPETIFTCENHFAQGSTFFLRERALEIGGLDPSLDMVADTDFWIRFTNYNPIRLNAIYRSGQIFSCATIHETQRSTDLSKFYFGRAQMGVKHLGDSNIPYSDNFKQDNALNLIYAAIKYCSVFRLNSKVLQELYKNIAKGGMPAKRKIKNILLKWKLTRHFFPEINALDNSLLMLEDRRYGFSLKWFK